MKKEKNKCPVCGNNMTKGKTVYSVDLGYTLIVVRNVDALVCEFCGEEWIDNETSIELEKITEEAMQKRSQVEISAM